MSDKVNGCPRCERLQHDINEVAKIRNQYFVDVRDLESRLAESQRRVEELDQLLKQRTSNALKKAKEKLVASGHSNPNFAAIDALMLCVDVEEENARLKALLDGAVEALKGYYECTMCKARTEKKWGRSCSVIDGVCLWRKVDHSEILTKLQEARK